MSIIRWVIENIIKDPRFAISVLTAIVLILWLNPLPVGAMALIVILSFASIYTLGAVVRAVAPKRDSK